MAAPAPAPARGGCRRIFTFLQSPMTLLPLLLVLLHLCLSSAEDPIIARFQEYLRINTVQPNPDYYKAVDFINTQAKSLSLESQTIELVKGKPLLLLKWVGSDPSLPALLLNSHTDVVPFEESKWIHHPLQAHIDHNGDIYARGSQDMKCVGMQYLEAIRKLQASGFKPIRSVYLSFVPDEEIGGHDGVEKFVQSETFKSLNLALVLDEGLPSPTENYRVFYGERSPWWLVIKAKGPPGHGAKLYDNSAMENLLKSLERIQRFRASQFDLLKAGGTAEGDVVSVNCNFLKAGRNLLINQLICFFLSFIFTNSNQDLLIPILLLQGLYTQMQPLDQPTGSHIASASTTLIQIQPPFANHPSRGLPKPYPNLQRSPDTQIPK